MQICASVCVLAFLAIGGAQIPEWSVSALVEPVVRTQCGID